MDKFELRRAKLIWLRDHRCGGVAAELAKKIEKEPSYVSRMLYPEGKTGKKRIAEDMAEIIERAFNMPIGWMSSEDSATSKTDLQCSEFQKLRHHPLIQAMIDLMLGLDEAGKGAVYGAAITVARSLSEQKPSEKSTKDGTNH